MTITGATTILGLIADPLVQARSPGLVNALLERRGLLGKFVLVPMHVGVDGLADFTRGLRLVRNFAGAIVSMPHKIAIADLVDEMTPEARLVGAVNVIRHDAAGRLFGTMLDGAGFVGGLSDAGYTVRGRACLLVGAGGAASAVAFALAKYGCASLTIVNRTQRKAAELATRVAAANPSVRVSTTVDRHARFDIAVNGTSLGMRPDDALPLTESLIDVSALVAECVIAPEMTRLLTVARERGRAIHTGVPMLTAQLELMLNFMGVA